MASATRRRKRAQGSIEDLPSGALRVSVYAGVDPLTKRRHYLRETIPAGTPKAGAEAEKVLRRLRHQVDERRHPRTSATLEQLLERHLKLLESEIELSTLRTYRGYVANHITPLVGHVKVGAFDADLMDSYYAELRRCRRHCDRRPFVEHRTARKHTCDDRCRPHTCRSLGAATVRQIHFILSGAFRRALRWKWVGVNPMPLASPPSAPVANPDPPSTDEAARILQEAFRDPDWGTFVWLAMTTGARRGELCALRWSKLDLDQAVAIIDASIGQNSGKTWEKSTKTHQHRRIALDAETVSLLREHRVRCDGRAALLDLELAEDAFVFSIEPDNSRYLLPDSVSQRYRKLVRRLGIETHLHNLRHYSATELITAGVDVRTVAGRLGHGGGGTTTLRVYTAWVAESDQRAADSLFARMPARPVEISPAERAQNNPAAPYERIAAGIRDAVSDGTLRPGDALPAISAIAADHGVSEGTARRAVRLLTDWGVVNWSARSAPTVAVRR